jgi:hypothetical protein
VNETRQQMAAKEGRAMSKHGWYAHAEVGDPQSPTSYNYHTHGFVESLGHLDIQVVLPMPESQCHAIATTVYQRIRDGTRFDDGDVSSKIIPNFSVRFIKVRESDREVLRVILPGRNGEVEPAKLGDEEEPEYALQWTVTVV